MALEREAAEPPTNVTDRTLFAAYSKEAGSSEAREQDARSIRRAFALADGLQYRSKGSVEGVHHLSGACTKRSEQGVLAMDTTQGAEASDPGERMKVLWITNVSLPEGSELRGKVASPFGGWLAGAARSLAQRVDLSVASLGGRSADPEPVLGERITHYEFPPGSDPRESAVGLAQIIDSFDPDIVHIFGTEYRHTRLAAELCANQERPFVISIQGLVSVYAGHYASGLPTRIRERFTLRDLLRADNIRLAQRAMRKRGIDEIAALRLTPDVIGRTTWDEACTSQINPRATYHKCNENLRASFYEGTWSTQDCERYSIFISQGSYPIKGLHFMLEAMPIILRRFPETRLFVAGPDVTGGHSLLSRLKVTSYGKYVRELIRKNGLGDHVTFTGVLDEAAMRSRHLQSHVFALTSTIENSPNSLGEAMLLGVPCVAAAVGGVMDMARPEVDALIYQGDAPYMLAHQICRVFSDDDLAEQLSRNARSRAEVTHDVDRNTATLLSIYQSILNEVKVA